MEDPLVALVFLVNQRRLSQAEVLSLLHHLAVEIGQEGILLEGFPYVLESPPVDEKTGMVLRSQD